MQPGSYKSFSIEPLLVEPEEMVYALRWRIKDMINFPVAEAAIDYFEIPNPAPKTNKNMLNVVVTRISEI